MFDFRFFPGVDFSKINLDWIMRKIGLLETGQGAVEEAAEQATAAAEQATTAAEQATTAAEDATEAVEAIVGTANEAKQIAQNALTQADTAREETTDLYSKFPVSVENGGTGATNVINARANLGLTLDSSTNYSKLPDGTLMCWGTVVVSSGAYIADVTFSAVFKDTNYSLTFGIYDDVSANITAKYTGGARIGRTPNTANNNIDWLAIGRWK